MANARAGYATLTIDGTPYDVVGDLKFSAARNKLDLLSGQSGANQGSKSMPVNGYISAKLRDNTGIDTGGFADMASVTVIGILVSGKTVSGSNLTQTGEIEVDTMEATFEVKFEGLVEEN